MTTWTNSDGLLVRFGTDKAAAVKGGVLKTEGDLVEVRARITGTDVPSTDAPVSTSKLILPQGAYIEESILYVITAFETGTGGNTGSLDIGVMNDDGDGTFSTKDDNGLHSLHLTAALAGDARLVGTGALINTTLQNTAAGLSYGCAISYGYNAKAFTAGVAELVVRYRVVS